MTIENKTILITGANRSIGKALVNEALRLAVSMEIEVLRQQAPATERVIRLNVEGISHKESLIQPQPAGNCLNWVIGHLVSAYESIFPLLGQEPVMGEGRLKPCERHSSPLNDSAEAVAFEELFAAFGKASERVDAALASLAQKKLDDPAPYSPTNNPKETVRSLPRKAATQSFAR